VGVAALRARGKANTRIKPFMNHASQRIHPIATHDPRSPRAVVGIRPADLLRSVYVVGKTGTGKSTFLENLLLRSADAGFGAALIDPHGDLFWRILENLPSRHWNRVAILRPADAGRPVGVNLLGALAWGSRALVASGRHRNLSHALGTDAFRPAVGACAPPCGSGRS
jgi:DNA helicase HerA-like ATPase